MYARAHPNMIYFTIIAYPKTYFNTIFNKICPPYILRGLCTLVHNMPVFLRFFAVFCRFFRLLSALFSKRIFALYAILSQRIQPLRHTFIPFSQGALFLYQSFANRCKIPDIFAVLCAYLSFRQINLRTRSRVFLFQG